MFSIALGKAGSRFLQHAPCKDTILASKPFALNKSKFNAVAFGKTENGSLFL